MKGKERKGKERTRFDTSVGLGVGSYTGVEMVMWDPKALHRRSCWCILHWMTDDAITIAVH
ncbi:hypothetical protein PanWU01x14_149590, partial [Parasponia andersonii]